MTHHVDFLDPSSLSHTLQAAARAALETAVTDEVSDTMVTAMALAVCEETRLFLKAQLLDSYARTEEERLQTAKPEEVVESMLTSADSTSSHNSTGTGTTSDAPSSSPAEPLPLRTSSALCTVTVTTNANALTLSAPHADILLRIPHDLWEDISGYCKGRATRDLGRVRIASKAVHGAMMGSDLDLSELAPPPSIAQLKALAKGLSFHKFKQVQ